MAKSIAQRKTWKKFGRSSNDKPGPDPATTITAEDVQMQVCPYFIFLSHEFNLSHVDF